MQLRFASCSRKRLVPIVGIIAWSIAAGAPSDAAPVAAPGEPAVFVGWNGHLVLGCWTLLAYDVRDDANLDGARFRLDVEATDPDGNFVTYVGEETSLAPGQRRLLGRFQLGQVAGRVIVHVYRDGKILDERELPQGSAWQPHTQAERLLITVGLPSSVQAEFDASAAGKRTVIHLTQAWELPPDDTAYDGVLGLLLAGKQLLHDQQSAAIARWVRAGGQLYLSLTATPDDFHESPLASWLPLEVAAKPIATREFSSLETYAGKSVRIVPTGQRLDVPKITFSAGKSLAVNRSDDFLVRVPCGFGAATVLGLDVTRAPLLNWEGLGDLLRKMTSAPDAANLRSDQTQQLGSTGISELSSQVSASLEHFESVSRTSPWSILFGLFVVLALIGPLDYWLVDRIWKKPLVTWFSFPVLLVACSALTLWAAAKSNGDLLMLNQLDVIDIDVATGSTRGRHWATLYSPRSEGYDVRFAPAWPLWNPVNPDPVRILAGWCGLPEPTFGGLYQNKSSAVQFALAEYAVRPAQGQIDRLPMSQWSTVPLGAHSSGTLEGVAESNLKSSATGRLSGSLVHHLPAPLEDCFLAFQNRIYRLPGREGGNAAAPWEPGTPWQVDQPLVVQRELRGLLTQTTAQQVKRSDATGDDIQLKQVTYDQWGRNLAEILPILTFHEEVGGSAYTGLTNNALQEHDLTPLLALGRAVLVGYLPAPACDVTVTPGEKPAGRRTTLVRIVLPVDKSKQLMRDLPRNKP